MADPPDSPPPPGADAQEGFLSRDERRQFAREFRRDSLQRFVRKALGADRAGTLDKPQKRILSREFRTLGIREKQEALDELRRRGSPGMVKFIQMALNAHYVDAPEGIKSVDVFLKEAKRFWRRQRPSRLAERDLLREFRKLSPEDQVRAAADMAAIDEGFASRLRKLIENRDTVSVLG